MRRLSITALAACLMACGCLAGELSPLIPFVALTGRPSDAEVTRKVEAMHRDGIDQFLLYGRFGLEYEYLGESWLHMIETFCAEAERRGMKVWLYDEFAWPSGSCNMRILEENREWRLNERGVWRDADGRLKWERAFSKEVSNVFEPDATRRFVQLTHEVYSARLRPYFDRGLIRGIFTDEPGTPLAIAFEHEPLARFASWRGLDEEYAAETGGRSLEKDVEAFVDDKTKDEVWVVYSRLKARRFASAFYGPVNDWCRREGVESTGHLTEELCMTSGPIVQGDLLKLLKAETLPGMDEIFTNTRKGDIEWITFAVAQHAAARRKGGPGGLVELFAIGPNDMSVANMRQMIWLEALHGVDHYLVSMEVMDHRGLKKKYGYLSPVQEGQPWHRHLRVLADEARRAAAFARKPAVCEIAVRYPQRTAVTDAYRLTGGAFRWNILKGPDLRGLLAELKGRQLDCDLVEEDEKTDRRYVLKVVPDGFVEERSGRHYSTARAVSDDLLKKIASPVRVYEKSGAVADDLVVRTYADGSSVLLNIGPREDRTLVAEVGGKRTTFVLPWRGALVLERGQSPRAADADRTEPLDVKAFDLSIDRDNLHRIVIATNGCATFSVAKGAPAVRFVIREWPTRAVFELDGQPLAATAPTTAVPVEYRPLYRETAAQVLTPGEHRLRLVSGDPDAVYFLPAVMVAGPFSAAGGREIRPLVRQATPGPLADVGLDGFVGDVTYRAEVTVPNRKDVRLRLPKSEAVVSVRWNGRPLGVCAWAPYEWAMPAEALGKTGTLELTVSTAVVNMCGDPSAREWLWLWRRARDRKSEGLASLPEWTVRSVDETWPFAILRSYGSYADNARFTERVFAAQERHPGLFNEIWFGGDGGLDYTAAERGKNAAEKNLSARERCHKLGIAFSYQQGVTLNHGADGLKRAHVPEDAWAVNREGKTEYGLLCCTSPWTIGYLRETAKEILSRLQPDSYWPDDDMRLLKGDWHVANLCFCDRCVKLFGESYGEAFTRETLVDALNGEGGSPSVRKAWSDFNGKNLGTCTKVYREAVDAVSPKTRLGIQIALSGNTVDGDSWKTMVEALAGKDGKAGTRPGGLYYTDFNPRDLPTKMLLVAREAARSGDLPQTAQICYEDENWPHVGGHKNAHAMMAECAWSLAVGCDSIAFYWGADQNGEDAASHDFWLESVWQWRPFHLAVRDAFAGTRLGGVAAFHGANHWATKEWANHDEDELPALVSCGVPVTVTEAAPDALWLNERCVATLAESDFENVFSRPVLMSAAAFDALAKRFPTLGFVNKVSCSFPSGEKALATAKRANGYELFPSGLKSANVKAYVTAKAADVKAFSTMTADPATCGTCVVPTEFGGKVVVAQEVPGHWPHGVRPGSRRHAILDALDFATPGRQPVRLLTDGYSIAVNVRKTADGRTAGVFLFNLGLGETPSLELAIRRGASESWTVSQPRRPSVAAEVVRTSADETVIRIPPMGAYDALLVSGTSKMGTTK